MQNIAHKLPNSPVNSHFEKICRKHLALPSLFAVFRAGSERTLVHRTCKSQNTITTQQFVKNRQKKHKILINRAPNSTPLSVNVLVCQAKGVQRQPLQ